MIFSQRFYLLVHAIRMAKDAQKIRDTAKKTCEGYAIQ
jgi:hypothetical protein